MRDIYADLAKPKPESMYRSRTFSGAWTKRDEEDRLGHYFPDKTKEAPCGILVAYNYWRRMTAEEMRETGRVKGRWVGAWECMTPEEHEELKSRCVGYGKTEAVAVFDCR